MAGSLIDNVSVTAVPEPASAGWPLAGGRGWWRGGGRALSLSARPQFSFNLNASP